MDFTPQLHWPRQLLMRLLILLALVYDFNLQDLPSYKRPRRVFTRGFVALCVIVVLIELTLLHLYYTRSS